MVCLCRYTSGKITRKSFQSIKERVCLEFSFPSNSAAPSYLVNKQKQKLPHYHHQHGRRQQQQRHNKTLSIFCQQLG